MVELLVFQPTAFCNLNCRYCYVPDRDNRARMPIRTIARTAALLSAEPATFRDSLEVLWHAGEPLAARLDFYHEAGRALDALAAIVPVVHTFQTNAMLITDEWCRYFSDTGALVGVSVDGPRDIHDANRLNRRGGGSHAATMRGIERLMHHGLEVNALAVVTAAALGRAADIFEFFCGAGIRAVGFNVEEIEGQNLRSSLGDVDDSNGLEGQYRAFMRELLELNLAHGLPLWIREIQATAQGLMRRRSNPKEAPLPAEVIAGRILTVTRNGDVFSWSPELASGLPGAAGHFSIGNVHSVCSLSQLLEGEKARQIQAEIDAGVDQCRSSCRYFGICGGGSPANKVYENGSFASTATIKCRLQVQVLADLLLDLAKGSNSGAARTAQSM